MSPAGSPHPRLLPGGWGGGVVLFTDCNSDCVAPRTGNIERAKVLTPYEQKRNEAEQALSHPDFSHPRKPTSYFAGNGFSQSMPESEFKMHRKLLVGWLWIACAGLFFVLSRLNHLKQIAATTGTAATTG